MVWLVDRLRVLRDVMTIKLLSHLKFSKFVRAKLRACRVDVIVIKIWRTMGGYDGRMFEGGWKSMSRELCSVCKQL